MSNPNYIRTISTSISTANTDTLLYTVPANHTFISFVKSISESSGGAGVVYPSSVEVSGNNYLEGIFDKTNDTTTYDGNTYPVYQKRGGSYYLFVHGGNYGNGYWVFASSDPSNFYGDETMFDNTQLEGTYSQGPKGDEYGTVPTVQGSSSGDDQANLVSVVFKESSGSPSDLLLGSQSSDTRLNGVVLHQTGTNEWRNYDDESELSMGDVQVILNISNNRWHIFVCNYNGNGGEIIANYSSGMVSEYPDPWGTS